jgi:hypothetical protein
MGSLDSGEMPEMPGIPPEDEPSLLSRMNNWNIADALDNRIGDVEDFLNKDAGEVAKALGHMVWDALAADEEKKDAYLDSGIIPEIDLDLFE